MQIKADGKIVLFAKNPEVGQGVKTSLPMIVAEELDADWTKVEVRQSIINRALYGTQVAGGSTSMPTNFESCGAPARPRARCSSSAAAKTWSVPASELTTENSTVRHAASNRSARYGELAERRDVAGARRRSRNAQAAAELALARHARHGRRQREARER